ncbi:MAG: hypothetical protein IK125_01010 [Lachnospiraceae bacterium]|nr:hypothetical protein [Lachnospiraceae bacterium]
MRKKFWLGLVCVAVLLAIVPAAGCTNSETDKKPGKTESKKTSKVTDPDETSDDPAGPGNETDPKETGDETGPETTGEDPETTGDDEMRKFIVGDDIAKEEITEFYYTYSTTTYPPEYQRYRLFAEDGKYYLYHEKREGDHWPLTEVDATITGTIPLSDEEFESLWVCLKGGTVIKRVEHTEGGDPGPWLFLYWNGDKDKYQEFAFAGRPQLQQFEEVCEALAAADSGN